MVRKSALCSYMKNTASLTLYSLNSPWTEFRSTGFQWMLALVLSTLDTRRSVGASVGSEHMKKDTVSVNSLKRNSLCSVLVALLQFHIKLKVEIYNFFAK